MNNLSFRIQNMSYSQTLAMSAKAREFRKKGYDVINLSIGSPDFKPPEFILNAAKEAIEQDYHQYSPVGGYLDLKEAVCNKFKRDNLLSYKPSQIVVSTGAKQSIINLYLALLDKGDEIIIPSPYWVSYYAMAKFVEAIPCIIKTSWENHFKITPDQLKKAISNKTKAFIFSSPCNPSGSAYTKEELKALVDVFKDHPNIVIISDEIYEYILYEGSHVSIAQFPEVYEQTVTLNGLSKAFSMTGWRVGYMGAPEWIAKACEKVQGQMTSGTNSIAQRAAIAALKAHPTQVAYMRDIFKKRRDLIVRLTHDIEGFKTHIPQGAFYVFPDVSEFLKNAQKDKFNQTVDGLANFILEKAHVALVGGSAFGDDNALRMSYALEEEKIQIALDRIKKVLKEL